jgi:hypothetical protein
MADDNTNAKAKAGQARAKSLTKERRSEIARAGAIARWSAAAGAPRAVNEGVLKIGEIEIKCAVLDSGKRLINQESFLAAIGRAKKAKAGTGAESGVDNMPAFIAADNLKPFISDDLRESTTPIMYTPFNGGRAFGYDATLLPKVCDVYLRLRDEKKDLPSQKHIVQAAYMLMRGLATVGIIALVDRATGYEERAQRDEILKILEKYIAPELMPWTKRFSDDFFRELYRLREWVYTGSSKRSQFVGKLINKYIYEQLPPGVHDEIKRRNPATPDGRRRYKNAQFLTSDTGIPHLDDQIRSVTMLMRISDSQQQFEELFERAFGRQKRLPLVIPTKALPAKPKESLTQEVTVVSTT